MGERRKRKSLWDHEEEPRHLSGISGHHSWTGKDYHSGHDSGQYNEFSKTRTTIMGNSRDHSGYQSWESIEEDPIPLMNGNFKNSCNKIDMVEGKRFYEEMSPGYDNTERHDYIQSHDYDRSHLQRYPGRGRSRSRSRSRTKGRSPSGTYSRDRGREGAEGFSRSRSRSRSYSNAMAYSRSPSPMLDYRRLSYEWSGRRNSSEKPSQICREFASGSCRRGSRCRFSHPSGGPTEHDINEWRSRADLSHIPKHSYRRGSGYESWNDISDHYHRDDDQFPKKNRNMVPCKDFIKGNCRYGDNCRFSHTAASDGSFGQGTRNVSYEKYVDRDQYKNGRPPCKFFAAGKCDRKNCRFSHEDPNYNDRNGMPSEVTASGSSRETNKFWNGPTWDEARPPGNRKFSGWGESTITDAAAAGKASGGQNDNREGQSDTIKCWKHPTRDDEAKLSGTQKSSGWGESTLTNPTDAVTASGERSDNREGRSDASKCWNGPTWDDEARTSDAPKFMGWGACTVTNAAGEGNASGEQNDNREARSDTSKCWNRPTWDDKASPLDAQKSIGWGESTATNAAFAGNVNGRPNDNRKGQGNRSKCWNGPTWDDEAKPSDTQKSTGWGVSTVTDSAGTKYASSGQNENKEGWILESKEKKFESLKHTSSPLNMEGQLSLAEQRSNYGRDSGPTENVAKGNMAESHALHSSWLQDQAGIGKVGHNALQENNVVQIDPLQQNLYPASHIQTQFSRTAENRVLNSTCSDNFGDAKETRYHNILFPGQSLNLNSESMVAGHSSISNPSDGPHNTLGPSSSNGFSVDLNVPEAHTVDHLNMESQTHNNQKLVHSPGLLGAKISPVKNPVPLPQRHEQTQTNAGAEARRTVPPFSDTLGGADLVNPTSTLGNPCFRSLGNGKGYSEHGHSQLGSHSLAQAEVPIVKVEQSHPLSVSCMDFDDSKEKHPNSPTSRQEVIITKSGVAEGNKVVEETSKGTQENKQTGMLGNHGKLEEGNNNKDEKGMRIFKNSLVEFIKEILKPNWKEGRISRDAYKAVVKKVVDKISCSIQPDHIPKTQDKVDLYLSHSKPKIMKLVQAYVDRCPKGESGS